LQIKQYVPGILFQIAENRFKINGISDFFYIFAAVLDDYYSIF